MANRNWASGGKIYSMHVKPVLLDCTFVVDNTNAAGISSLKGPCVSAVYMHTTTTPVAGSPNPAAGYIMLKLADNYNSSFICQMSGKVSPASGSPLTAVTAGLAYTITALGTASLAQWQAKGVPVGFTPAIGLSFIATASGTIGGSAAVQVPATAGSGVTDIEIVGDPNMSIAGNSAAGPTGGYLIMRCLGPSFSGASFTPAGTISAPVLTMNSYTPAGTNDGSTPPLFTGTPAVLTGSVSAPVFTGTAGSVSGTAALAIATPANGSLISLGLYLSDSSIQIAGE